ncbi:Hypothetical protein R9X50_00113100 [Acrodontium crateriforme]|uniref:Manganese lipoxygenase n=1 Tax=Acrodontium crateriforme TaxID=150365 RepID=A0AAQ3M1H5_9PEZI|nr:Hypothetical protein R9X50_00113100 [Acrodontium crateriforme]
MFFQRVAFKSLALLYLGTILDVNASVIQRASSSPVDNIIHALNGIDTSGASKLPDAFSFDGTYTIPQQDTLDLLRGLAITTKRITFTYGPPVGGGPYYPSGIGGIARSALDTLAINSDVLPELAGSALDLIKLTAQIGNYDGLQTVDDYVKLYANNLENTLPKGPDSGSLTNFTQDLFFSSERLSHSPYQIRRLNPSSDILSFQVDDATAKSISGETLSDLFNAGRLFYADYRDQANLEKSAQFSAACDAYFYMDEKSGSFLPMAIRTNVGSNLIYTPKDTANDWLLAKIMFNVNDFWFAQLDHLARTHETIQISYMAAIRTLSEEHPVLGMLNRLMLEVFGAQPLAVVVLFLPGGIIDQIFGHSGRAAQSYATDYYQNKGSGSFKSTYFKTELRSRGLIDCSYGPDLKHFPFYEDGSVIFSAIETFMTSFVDSFYADDSVITGDSEIQAWWKEAQGPAKAIDFPSILTKGDLVDVLTHMAHLSSISHHTINTNELLEMSQVLPFHPAALYKAPPTSKGVTNVADYLPHFDKVILQLLVGGLFARPKLVNTERTLLHMFDDANLLSRMNDQTTAAAAKFKRDMQAFSSQVSLRTFDAEGLSQGMPFVWKALDPNVALYSTTT